MVRKAERVVSGAARIQVPGIDVLLSGDLEPVDHRGFGVASQTRAHTRTGAAPSPALHMPGTPQQE